jgi:hypothetical protein
VFGADIVCFSVRMVFAGSHDFLCVLISDKSPSAKYRC